jgi:hypothetical protein
MDRQFTRDEINSVRQSYGCGMDEAKRRLMNWHLHEQLSEARTVDQLKTIISHLIDRGFPAP